MSALSLEGRVVFVSGASRGIGAGIAARFAERGMKLVLCSRTTPALASSGNVIAQCLDVRDEIGLEALVAEAEARWGGIDLWINNAGVLDPIAPLRGVPLDAFREHFDINLVGVFVGSKCYVNHLRRTGNEGVLINVSSGAATKAYSGWGAYCAAKAAVERLTEVLAVEESEAGLRAYSVAPGVVDTDMQALIRTTPIEQFPDALRFRRMKQEDAFNSERFVADEFLKIAFDATCSPDTVAVRLANEPRQALK